jgi:hypothetical protein
MTKIYVVLEISVMRAFQPTVFNNWSYNTYIELITENYQHAYAPQTAAYSGSFTPRSPWLSQDRLGCCVCFLGVTTLLVVFSTAP